jgi:hypothetical protein
MARTCELCRLANEYRRSSTRVGIPILANAALAWVDALSVRSLNSALHGAAVDLFDEHLDGDSLQRLSNIRTVMENAEHGTEFREVLNTRLTSCISGWPDAIIAGKPGDPPVPSRVWAQDFIRILIVEPQRLKRPPLQFRDLRETVAAICVKLLTEGQTISDELEIQCVGVLRRASKRGLIASIGAILRARVFSQRVAGAVLFEVWTILMSSLA